MAIRLPRRAGFILGLVVLIGAFGYMYFGIVDSMIFWMTPTEVLEARESLYDKPIRLAGVVKPGSVQWNADALDLRLIVQDTVPADSPAEIAVHSRSAPPAMLAMPGIAVVVEGRYTRGGVFEASKVMAMHSNEYRELPEGMPSIEERARDLLEGGNR